MLHILVIGTFLMLVLCFYLFERDFMHPAFIFSLAFLVFELFCLFNAENYRIKLEPETVIIILGGMIIFYVCSYLVSGKTYVSLSADGTTGVSDKYPVIISNTIMIGIIILQILAIILFYRYLTDIYENYYGSAGTIAQKIGLYNDLSKFSAEEFIRIAVSIPNLYNKINLITSCVPYIVIVVFTYNLVLFKKINILQIISIGLLVISMLLRGSRSPLFRIFTLVVFVLFIVKYREIVRKKMGVKFFVRLAAAFLIVGMLLYLSLYIMGRDGTENVSHKLFVYLGAPIDNLDNYIAQGQLNKHEAIWGEYTFSQLFSYFKTKGIIRQAIHSTTDVLPFVKTANGNGAGNVATMYYFFLLDFGYWGIVPLTAVIGLFFSSLYHRLLRKINEGKWFSFTLVIYAYLFNDLIMLPFSNRFYETVVTVPMLKFVLIAWLFVKVFIEKNISIFGFNIDFNNFLGGLIWNKEKAG